MKNTFVLLALSSLLIASCSKDQNTVTPGNVPQQATSTPASGARIGTVPTAFTQKVLLENFTSASNGNCPANDNLIDQNILMHPDQIIEASFHKNDLMKTSATAALYDFTGSLNPLHLPAMMVNRTASNNNMIIEDISWTQLLNTVLTKKPECGLAIASNQYLATNRIEMSVHAGFSTNTTGNYYLCVYLTENMRQNGPGYDQANSFNNNAGSMFYHAGNPIVGYTHKNVLRKVITSLEGVAIPVMYQTAGSEMIYVKPFSLPSNVNFSEASIVAFVYNKTTHEVMNVQEAPLGTTKDWN